MDTERGRKNVGGKIEIIMKVREPLVDKDVEVVNEKWLVLESHLRTLQMVSFLSDLFTTYLIRLFLLVHLLVISLPYLEKVLFIYYDYRLASGRFYNPSFTRLY